MTIPERIKWRWTSYTVVSNDSFIGIHITLFPFNLQKEPQCVFGQIDGEKNYKISIEEHVGVYPTFVFYPKDNKDGETYLPGKYDERWSEKNITKFMNAYCQANFNENVIEEKMVNCCPSSCNYDVKSAR